MRHLLGIDIGATNLKIALFDPKKRSLSSLHVEKTNHENIVRQVYDLIDNMPTFEGIGLALPGLLDPKRRVWLYSPNIKSVKNLKLAETFERKYGTPVALANDTVAAVMGEKMFGAGKSIDNLVYITLSTGIGAGVIIDGRLVRGKAGGAHEIGHSTIDMNGIIKCSCGSYGHWEGYCAGIGIPRFAKYLLETKYKSEKSALARMGTISPRALFDAAKVDITAAKIVNEIGRINAIGVANAVNVYDPELVTLGGGITLANPDAVMKPIKKYVRDYCFNDVPKIIPTPLGEHIALYGAVSQLPG